MQVENAIIIVFLQRTLKEKLPIFLINTLLLHVPLLALTDGRNDGQRNKLILVRLGNLPGFSRLIICDEENSIHQERRDDFLQNCAHSHNHESQIQKEVLYMFSTYMKLQLNFYTIPTLKITDLGFCLAFPWPDPGLSLLLNCEQTCT